MNEEIQNIIDAACRVFSVEKKDLFCSQAHYHASARSAVYHEIRKAGKVEKWNRYGLTMIARTFGRDHSTVTHGLKKYQEWRQYDSAFRELAEKLERELTGVTCES